MKTKTLIGMAVASTFGWSAATFAGAGHEVVTPFSPNESGEVLTQLQSQDRIAKEQLALGSTFDSAGGTIGGSMTSDGSTFLGSGDPSASLSESSSMDESLALGDTGIYSDYYLVGYTPIDSWDHYVIDTDQLSAAEDVYFLTPSYDVVWVSGDMFPDSSMSLGD